MPEREDDDTAGTEPDAAASDPELEASEHPDAEAMNLLPRGGPVDGAAPLP